MINVEKLTKELTMAGIKTAGCNSNGIVWAEDGTTEIQDRKDVKAVIAKHSPEPEYIETPEEKIERIITEKLKLLKG